MTVLPKCSKTVESSWPKIKKSFIPAKGKNEKMKAKKKEKEKTVPQIEENAQADLEAFLQAFESEIISRNP